MEISYSVTVTEGHSIDVLFVDSGNFDKYENGDPFAYEKGFSDLDTRSAGNSATLSEHGTYFIIFDNTDVETVPLTDDVVRFTYEVEWNERNWKDGALDLFLLSSLIISVILVILGLVGVTILLRRRRKAQELYLSQAQQYYPMDEPPPGGSPPFGGV